LYTNIDKLANPVSDLLVRESHLCFIRGQMPKTAGRDRYKLLIGDYESCQNDPTSWSLAEIGEKDYFDINDVPYGKLTTFDTNNDYKYKLFAGRYLEWSPSCSDAVPSLTKKGEDLTYIKKQMLILLILYSIVIGLMGIYNIAQVLLFLDDKKKIYKRVYFARLVAFVLIAPSLIIVTVHTGRFVKYFKNIVDIKCSTDDSNVQFEKIYTHYDQKVYKRVVVMIVLAFCNLIVDSLVAMIFLGVHETIGEWLDRARSPHNSPDSLAKRNNDQLPPPIDTKYNQVSPVPPAPADQNVNLSLSGVDSTSKLTAKPDFNNQKNDWEVAPMNPPSSDPPRNQLKPTPAQQPPQAVQPSPNPGALAPSPAIVAVPVPLVLEPTPGEQRGDW